MTQKPTDSDAIDDRRAFVRELRNRADVRRLDFSRDGFRTIVVEFVEGANSEARYGVLCEARALGYDAATGAGRVFRLDLDDEGHRDATDSKTTTPDP